MKKRLNTLAVIAFTLISFTTYAQQKRLLGLWEVEKVEVGKENMTPVAKWFKINDDATFQAGNGWLQNANGTWKYDAKNNLYTVKNPLDIAEGFGGFTVSFSGEKMQWEREEDGMNVKVTLLPIEELPMSPADYLEGIWDLIDITDNETSILDEFDKENKHKLFIRWDRVYINFSSEGNKLTGYWHIHGHKPEITLLPHQENATPKSWRIEVNEDELTMTGISDSNKTIQRKYVRRQSF